MLNIIKFPLLPILLPQALWAKINTLKLPEAAGQRHGSVGQGKSINILILGDSAAAGVGTDEQSNALSGQLVALLSHAGYRVNWQLHACSGYTLKDSLDMLQKLPEQTFDFIFISSGVNDILQQHSIKKWQHHYSHIHRYAQQHFGKPQVCFSAVPPLQCFSALPRVLAWYLGEWAKKFNHNLEVQAQQLENFHFVAVNFPFDPAYLAKDGFHPNTKSYQLWASTLVQYLYSVDLL